MVASVARQPGRVGADGGGPFTFRRWLKALNQTGALPGEAEVRSTRRWVMVQSHILPVVAVIAVFWARGW